MSQFFVNLMNSAVGFIRTLTGNTGVATPVANNINVVTANTTVKFVGTAGNLTEDFGLSNILIGSSGPAISGAFENVSLGQFALASLTAGSQNVAIGFLSLALATDSVGCVAIGSQALSSINDGAANASIGIGLMAMTNLSSGVQNIAIGPNALAGITTQGYNTCLGYSCGTFALGDHNTAMGAGALCEFNGGIATHNTVVGAGCLSGSGAVDFNSALGSLALNQLGTGSYNSGFGFQSLGRLTSGSYCIALGQNSGLNYGSSESSNILIGNAGVGLENNVLRIGTQGSANGEQNQCFVAGISGVTTGANITYVTQNSSTTQLGATATLPTSAVLGSTNGVSPSAGFIGEQIRSYQSIPQGLTNGDGLNVTSISLTAGIWDVSAIVGYSGGSGTITLNNTISISSTSETVAGNYGDDTVVNSYLVVSANYPVNLFIPALRVSLSSTTTYYLVTVASFSAGTLSAYGRISATRVG